MKNRSICTKMTCTAISIATLIIVAKNGKQPKEWKNKIWYIYTIEYYSEIKRGKNWMNFKTVMLNKRIKTQEITRCPIYTMHLKQAKPIYDYKNQSFLKGGGGQRKWQISPGKRHNDAWNCCYMRNTGGDEIWGT